MVANQMKDWVSERKNRPVLDDIGNLLAVRGVDGQLAPEICNPAAGTLCTQSKSSAQTAAVVKNHKVGLSIVTPWLKALIGLTDEPYDQIIDIDASDNSNDLATVKYVKEIYDFYRRTECNSQVHDHVDSQPEIDMHLRALIVDYLIQVHECFKLQPEALYLAVNILDRFLSVQAVAQGELQLVGISAIFIASKYEKQPCAWPLQMSELTYMSAEEYTREQILTMETNILLKLKWNLAVPTPYVFLIRFIKASIPDELMVHTSHFFGELGVTYNATVMNPPSILAASAVYTARLTLKRCPVWDKTLEHYTGYSEEQLLDLARLLTICHAMAAEGRVMVFRKYSQPERSQVALLPPATWCW